MMKFVKRSLVALSIAGASLLSTTAMAAHSEEEAIKQVQSANYNVITGNWDVELPGSGSAIAAEFKKHMPNLDYHLVDKESAKKKGDDRITLTFRGAGDQRVIVKLKENDGTTNVRIRVGLVGNEAKSIELFKYVFQHM